MAGAPWDRKTIPFGKYKGTRLDIVPTDYLMWVQAKEAGDFYDGFSKAVHEEIARRVAAEREFDFEENDMPDDEPYGRPPFSDRRSGAQRGPTDRTSTTWNMNWGDAKWSDADAGRGPSNTRTHACAYCTDGVLNNPSSYMGMEARFCQQCELGRAKSETERIRKHLQADVDRARAEARSYQTRMHEAEKRAGGGSAGSYGAWNDETPSAARVRGGSVSKAVAKSIIDKVRITFAAKYHTAEAQKDPEKVKIMADINACCDWFLKCVEQLTK